MAGPFTRRLLLGFTALTFAAAGMGQVAFATSGINLGVLGCAIAPGVGLVLGSSKAINCVYVPNEGSTQHYTGSITKFDVDLGFKNKSHIRWVVFAPGKLGAGALAGTYGGASAEAAIAIGLGANVLVGGLKKSITLQPLSAQGHTGLNLAAGIAGLKLKYGK